MCILINVIYSLGFGRIVPRGPRASLDIMEKRKISSPYQESNSDSSVFQNMYWTRIKSKTKITRNGRV
jgi:hypothetical protein